MHSNSHNIHIEKIKANNNRKMRCICDHSRNNNPSQIYNNTKPELLNYHDFNYKKSLEFYFMLGILFNLISIRII